MRVLVIEDDAQTAAYMVKGLTEAGHTVDHAPNGRDGLFLGTSGDYDAMIVDRMLPGLDGIAVIQALRAANVAAPILILSALGQVDERVVGLKSGADDYLTKPFGAGELLARMRVALRNAARSGAAAGETVFRTGELAVDLAARRVSVGGREVHLTRTQYKLLTTLVKNAGKVVTHRQLLREVWGPGSVEHSHYLRVYMGQLRHKLEKDPARPRYLETETGVGYRLRVE
jgi:two-component system, OmpR family, KDP operon response regulator KdpE